MLIFFVSTAHSQLVFKNSASSELMRLTSDGKLGLGTSAPSSQLHVTGDVRLSGLAATESNTKVLTVNDGGLVSTSLASSLAGGKMLYFGYKTTAQSMTIYNDLKLTGWTAIYDPQSMYHSSSSMWAVPLDGWYLVNAQLVFQVTGMDGSQQPYCNIAVRTHATESGSVINTVKAHQNFDYWYTPSAYGFFRPQVTMVKRLTAGMFLDVIGGVNCYGTLSVNNEDRTWVSIIYIAP